MRSFKVLFLCLIASCALAQEHYICYFKNKPHTDTALVHLSTQSLDRKVLRGNIVDERDYSAFPPYIDSVANYTSVKQQSRWLNAVLIWSTQAEVSAIESLPFVDSVTFLTKVEGGVSKYTSASIEGDSVILNQYLLDELPKGKGVNIAVIDGGFLGTDKIDDFKHLFDEGRIWEYNLLDTNSVYRYSQHGTQVLSVMASDDFGISPEANYYLFINEAISYESTLEEYLWIIAAEKADSIGVDVINSSLGYNFGHDYSEEDYSKSDLDGKTSLIARGAEIASEKGIVVVTTAGNEGDNQWSTLTTPGDAPNVITVGSIEGDLMKSSFSSVGPTADGRTKPEICARGGRVRTLGSDGGYVYDYGTSFAAPVIASIAALIIQEYPSYNPNRVKDEILKTGHQYPLFDNQIGYGAVDLTRLTSLLGIESSTINATALNAMQNVELYSNEGRLLFKGRGVEVDIQVLPQSFIAVNLEQETPQISRVINLPRR